MKEQSRYHNLRYAQHYDLDRFGGSFGRYLEVTEVAALTSAIAPYRESVLDVGAGTGKLSLPLLEQRRQVVSLDASLEMLSVAKSKALHAGLKLLPVICDVHNLCFGDHTFECVVCSRVLMHLRNQDRAIDELCRVAKTAIILDFPPLLSLAGVDSLFKRGIIKFIARVQPYRAFRVRQIVRRLTGNGFEIVSVRRQFFLPVILHRMLDRPKLSEKLEGFLDRLGLVRALGAPVTIKAVRNRQRTVPTST
jgi:ubiquinone/menaquinone biosynthesis C-methylase UbiE